MMDGEGERFAIDQGSGRLLGSFWGNIARSNFNYRRLNLIRSEVGQLEIN